jgi:hypothetical protein
MSEVLDTSAREKYHEARQRAMREDLLARIKGQPVDLIPYEAIAGILQAHARLAMPDVQSIPLDHIVGSVGRYRDFTRTFMPRSSISIERWTHIESQLNDMEGLPPIEVFQIGDVYFVVDGNHRVSVARANGFSEIDAYVTVIQLDVDVCLETGDTLDEAIVKAECAHFAAETELAACCGDLDVQFTHPGGYLQLLEHIKVHQYFIDRDHPDRPEATFQEAARDWHEQVYVPIVAAIERQDLLNRFPGMTAADLYIWASAFILELHQSSGAAISPDEAAGLVALQAPETVTPFYRAMLNVIERLASKAVEAVALGSADELALPNSMPGALPASGPVLTPVHMLGSGTPEPFNA